jgi:hypothetical protein
MGGWSHGIMRGSVKPVEVDLIVQSLADLPVFPTEAGTWVQGKVSHDVVH